MNYNFRLYFVKYISFLLLILSCSLIFGCSSIFDKIKEDYCSYIMEQKQIEVEPEHVVIYKYFGRVDGAYCIVIDSERRCTPYSAILYEPNVSIDNPPLIYKYGYFYNLYEAYDNNIISKTGLDKIISMIPTEEYLKQIYFNLYKKTVAKYTNTKEEKVSPIEFDAINIIAYLGTYGISKDYYALIIKGVVYGMNAFDNAYISFTDQYGNTIRQFFLPQIIVMSRKEVFYLQEAYEEGIIGVSEALDILSRASQYLDLNPPK